MGASGPARVFGEHVTRRLSYHLNDTNATSSHFGENPSFMLSKVSGWLEDCSVLIAEHASEVRLWLWGFTARGFPDEVEWRYGVNIPVAP